MDSRAPSPVRATFFVLLVSFVGLFSGCDESVSKSNSNAVVATNAVAGPGKDEKVCFGCNGQAMVACRVPGCIGGKVDCPGPCLKLSRGAWIHMNVAGHDPKELWQKFPESGGGYQAWTQGHVGEVVVMQKGKAVNIGKCLTCGGTTKVGCNVCKGLGKQKCEICNGKKFIPIAWTPTDNPWLNQQPDLIRLKDGRVLLGRVVLSKEDDRLVKTRDGKFTHINASDFVSKSDTNSAAAVKSSQ